MLTEKNRTARAEPATGREFKEPYRGDLWGYLESFGRELPQCERYADQVRLLLHTVARGLRADVVLAYRASGVESVEVVGGRGVSPEWCRALAEQLVRQVPPGQGQLLRSPLDLPAAGEGPLPRGAALVRLSKSRELWVIALTFDPDQAFRLGDLKWMGLARQMLADQAQHLELYEKLKDTVFGLVHSFTTAIDAKDPYTSGHSERVARIAVRLGQEMGLPGNLVSDLYLAGLLHDIGKIGIRDSVLLKPGRLTEEELAHIKEHPVIGERIVANIKQLAHLCPGIRSHHERHDGQGYPEGLAGDQIPLLGRILAVADACDAMVSDRPYRVGLPPRQIDLILSRGAGTQWDPNVVEHFLACRYDLYRICQKGIGKSVLVAVEAAMAANQPLYAHDLL
jgi:HD-GYP domain-containing protein (c-di-GMP phosphodiesterase class II)